MDSTLVTGRPRLARPGLAERLRSGLQRGPLILCAEAGFGKTSALEEAAEKLPLVAWVRCRAGDRDARRFLLHTIDALAAVAPGAVDVIAEQMAQPAAADVAGASADLVAELKRLLVDRVVLVVDDAELLADAAGSLDVLMELVAGAGETYGIAIATRVPLPLKLAKLRATGALDEVGAADLAFSVQECAELLLSRANRAPDPSEVEDIVHVTGGWPLGVALGAARDRLSEFLEEEVLSGATDDVRDRLLAASVLPELEPRLLNAVGLGDDLVEEARRRGLPLHQPLVREVLTGLLEESWPADRLRDLHARAAMALSATGREFEAVDHWLAAERFDAALGSMAAQLPGLAATAPEAVGRWLGSVPASLRSAPTCQLLEGHLAWSRGSHDLAVSKLAAAVDGFSREGNAALEWSARFALCDPLAMTGRYEEMAELADGFDSSGREAGMPAAATGFYGAMALGCVGRVDAMEQRVERLLAHPAGAMFASLRAGWEQFASVPRGAFDSLREAMSEAIAEYERGDPMNRLPHQLLVGALISMDQGRDDEALDTFRRMEELAGRAHLPYLVNLARAELARLHVRAGRTHEAEAELARAGPAPPGWQGYAWELARAGIAAQRGRAADAVAAADRTHTLAASATVLERVRIAAELVPIVFVAGAPARARAMIDDARELLDTRYPDSAGRYLRGVLIALRAWLRQEEGDTAGAVAELQAAWSESVRNHADLARRLRRMLQPTFWAALERQAIDAEELVHAIERAWPGGDALIDFTRHPLPDVRRRAAASSVASGRPDVVARLLELANDPDPEVAAAASAISARVTADPPPLSFQLFGGFAVRRGSWQPDDSAWERRVAQRLVRFLVTHRDSAASEDELIGAFWPEKGVRAARHSLHVALSCARCALDVPGATSVIETTERAYRLRLRPRDSVDVDAFERAAEAAAAAPADERLELLERAERLWGGEPLPEERYSDWAIPWREAVQDRYGAVLDALVDSCLRRGELAPAVDAARKLVALDELNEAAHRTLMLCYARSGRRAHALRQYLECRRLLVGELGIEPAAETGALQRRILAGEPV